MQHDDILTLGNSGIVDLAKGLSERNVAAGKISFGLRWTNLLKVTINWAQDFRRISQTPSLVSISNTGKLCAEIEAVSQRSSISTPYGWEDAITSNQNLVVIPWGTLQYVDSSLG